MRVVPIVNILLLVIFSGVVVAMLIMIGSTGYNDEVSHACFKLLGTAGILLMARLFFNADAMEEGMQ